MIALPTHCGPVLARPFCTRPSRSPCRPCVMLSVARERRTIWPFEISVLISRSVDDWQDDWNNMFTRTFVRHKQLIERSVRLA